MQNFNFDKSPMTKNIWTSAQDLIRFRPVCTYVQSIRCSYTLSLYVDEDSGQKLNL